MFEVESKKQNADVQMDGHINLTSGLVTYNLPKNGAKQYVCDFVTYLKMVLFAQFPKVTESLISASLAIAHFRAF